MVHRERSRAGGRYEGPPVAEEIGADMAGTRDAKGACRVVRIFRIRVSRWTEPDQVLSATGLPALRDELPGRPLLRCHALVPRQGVRAGEWEVEALYREGVGDSLYSG